MKIFLAGTALLASLLTSVSSVHAEDEKHNFYLSVFGGATVIPNNIEYSNGIESVDTDFDTGFTFGAALGYKWDDYSFSGITPRTEFEVSYSENNVNTIDFTGNTLPFENVAEGSQASAVGLIGSIFFDYNNIGGSKFTPYIGGGVGVNIINHNLLYNGGLNLNNDGDVAFAWHVTGGVAYEVTKRASLFTDIGFARAQNTQSERLNGAESIVGDGGGIFEDDIGTIVIKSGISIGF